MCIVWSQVAEGKGWAYVAWGVLVFLGVCYVGALVLWPIMVRQADIFEAVASFGKPKEGTSFIRTPGKYLWSYAAAANRFTSVPHLSCHIRPESSEPESCPGRLSCSKPMLVSVSQPFYNLTA